MMNDTYTYLWLAWFGLFIGIEAAALINKDKGDTLSEHIWKWFSVKEPGSRKRTIRVATLGAFLAWLAVHFLSGGKV